MIKCRFTSLMLVISLAAINFSAMAVEQPKSSLKERVKTEYKAFKEALSCAQKRGFHKCTLAQKNRIVAAGIALIAILGGLTYGDIRLVHWIKAKRDQKGSGEKLEKKEPVKSEIPTIKEAEKTPTEQEEQEQKERQEREQLERVEQARKRREEALPGEQEPVKPTVPTIDDLLMRTGISLKPKKTPTEQEKQEQKPKEQSSLNWAEEIWKKYSEPKGN